MEGKEQHILGGAIANYLFLSQFELMRATLLSLGERNPQAACDIYRAVILQVWKLKGIVWSESVPSSAHLAWMCLQELHAMEEKFLDKADDDLQQGGETLNYRLSRDHCWSFNCQPVYDRIEFLLLVEFLKSFILENGEAIAGDIKHKGFVDLGADEVSGESWQLITAIHGEDDGLTLCEQPSEGVGGTEGDEVEVLFGGKASANKTEDNSENVKTVGLQLVEKMMAAGLDRLNRTLQFVTGFVSEGGYEEEQVNNTERERQTEEKDADRKEHISESLQTIGHGKETLSAMERKWLHYVTLRHPQLLNVLCQNIWRQQCSADLDSLTMVSDRCVNGDNIKRAEEEDVNEDPVEKLKRVSKCPEGFEMGSVIQREVQHAHLWQIGEDMKAGQLVKAAQHLQYLHEDFAPSEAECSDAVTSIFRETKSKVGGEHAHIMMTIHECSLASGSSLIPRLVESAQDNILREDLQQTRVSPDELYPPALEHLHQQLQQLRLADQSASEGSSLTEAFAISMYLREAFQHARVNGAHILESVMKAALSSIKGGQLQRVADVMAPYPRLKPLVAVMGWDLLAGQTKERRQLMELLWIRRHTTEAHMHADSTEEMSCVEQLCEELCYRLELAYFVARVNSGKSGLASNIQIVSKGSQATNEDVDGAPASSFAANLVLERLAMHSPVQVIFDMVPDIKLSDALKLVKLQPTGTSNSAARRRLLDLELVHMHFGVQDAVCALARMELGASDDSKDDERQREAIYFLEQLHEHLKSITTPVRRVWMMEIVVSLLRMEEINIQPPAGKGLSESETVETLEGHPDVSGTTQKSEQPTAVAFVSNILKMLSQCMPVARLDFEASDWTSDSNKSGALQTFGFPGRAAKKTWMQKVERLQSFIDEWEWRLGVLQHLSTSSQQPWQWREALAVLHASPATLLNMCVQRNLYDLGAEAVNRFRLSPEEAATLQLAKWVHSALTRASVDDGASGAANKSLSTKEDLKFSALCQPLPPLANGTFLWKHLSGPQLSSWAALLLRVSAMVAFPMHVKAQALLCIDYAVSSVSSADMARQLLDRARGFLSQISANKGQGLQQHWEACMVMVAKRLVLRLLAILEQRGAPLQAVLSGADMVSESGTDSSRQVLRQRALAILQQTIEDANSGKQQFLSGKLHNLVKALADEDSDDWSTGHGERRPLLGPEHSIGVGLGFRAFSRQSSKHAPLSASSGSGDILGEMALSVASKGTVKRFLGSLSNKPMAYLSAFILYIATVGDIVDGVDTTHDFNFFKLIYERPSDLLTRLVFERGSADAAGKVAEVMGADLVHQIISACVPPVYPPPSGKGWVCIIPTHKVQSLASQQGDAHASTASSPNEQETQLYPLQLDVVKHLATLSVVRSVLACVFGQSRFIARAKSSHGADIDADHSFYDFALEQSERYPPLNRWIQLEANSQHLSDSTMLSPRKLNEDKESKEEERVSLKRSHPHEEDLDSLSENKEEDASSRLPSSMMTWNSQSPGLDKLEAVPTQPKAGKDPDLSSSYLLMFDWENETPYAEAVQRLTEEGKLVDALALADRWLQAGAPDSLLQLLIERGEETGSQSAGQWKGNGGSHLYSSSWQYCIRLHNKTLAATLALKYLQRWELDAAIDVLTMCSCHLSFTNPLLLEVARKRQLLQQYGRILQADNRFTHWQEVESLCQSDPEGLALRLAGKGAVSAALDVAETFKLSSDLRRELQGRQLVKLFTTDPINGGGPAGGLRFLNSLLQPEDALPVAMAAMEQLPNLQSKQLLVHFFLKRRVGTLSEEEHARLDRLALGLRMLGALPLPWQQRCSALHEHPRLILETLLMGKQLRAASQLLQAFPSLREDDLVTIYAAKALSSSNAPYERRTPVTSTASVKPVGRIVPPVRSNFSTGLTSLPKRAFLWSPRDTGNKIISPDSSSRKRKSAGTLPPFQKATWEALAGLSEEPSAVPATVENYGRPSPTAMTEEWVLTGDLQKDDAVRSSHCYESAPNFVLFKSLLELYSGEAIAAKAAVDLCIAQIKRDLSSEQLPLDSFHESAERAFHATNAFVKALTHAQEQVRKLMGKSGNLSSSAAVREGRRIGNEENASQLKISTATPGGACEEKTESSIPDLSVVLEQAELWLNRVELLQSLFGSYFPASLDDLLDEGAGERLRDRLIEYEHYNLANEACTKCKIDAFPVWEAWGHALLRIENYAQARVKFKQCLRLYKSDPAPVVRKIVDAMDTGPPADVFAARSLYVHMARSVSSSSDDSLSADSYLNVLYLPSFNKQDRSRRSSEDSADSHQAPTLQGNVEECPQSHLDDPRYEESVYYLQEYARRDLMQFMFQHCHYSDACCLFFPPDGLPPPPLPSPYQTQVSSSSPQRPDPLATEYGSLDELCDLCVSFEAVPTLERVIASRGIGSSNPNSPVAQHTAAALTRICTYFENHRHFNHLYRFQVLKKDYVAAGLCCIQLFLNSSHQDQALRHLEHAKVHFDEGLLARQQAGEGAKGATKAARGKLPSQKLTEEELIKFTARVGIQIEVVRTFGDNEGPPWRHSLFGNPNDADTSRRRCEVAEEMVERNFDLAFQLIYDFNLTAVPIYAGVAANLAKRKKLNQLMELLPKIKGTIDDNDWDQVLGAAINVDPNKRERAPSRLIEMLSSSHSKVLACVIWGRLKNAFQIASRSESASDVQYVAREARQSGSLAVLDMCKQWLASH